jgi:hypothetical protein
MATNADFKLVKEKPLDKGSMLRVTKNLMSGRIFVEFTSVSPKLTLQKNFQDSFDGRKKSEEFAKSIKNTNQLIQYFGLKREK